MRFSVGDKVVTNENILTNRFEVVVKKNVVGEVKFVDEDMYLVEFENGICGKDDCWWVRDDQVDVYRILTPVFSSTGIIVDYK